MTGVPFRDLSEQQQALVERIRGRLDGAYGTDATHWIAAAALVGSGVVAELAIDLMPPSPRGETCNRCGGPNVVWVAPSPLWNQVIREGSIDGNPLFRDLVCMMCFVTLATQQGLADHRRWRLYLDPEPEGLEKVTPSGRIWDPESWLWTDA